MINGDMLRQVRNNKGWTQERLLIESGVSKKTISKMERGIFDPGDEGLAQRHIVRRLAKALEVDMDYLMKGES